MTGFNAVVARQDRTFDDATDAGNVFDLLFGMNDAAIASGSADCLNEYAFFHAAADSAVVNIELPDGNRDAFG